MRSTVYETVERPSVRLSVCPVDRQQQRRAAGLLLSAPQIVLWCSCLMEYFIPTFG